MGQVCLIYGKSRAGSSLWRPTGQIIGILECCVDGTARIRISFQNSESTYDQNLSFVGVMTINSIRMIVQNL